ncbi:xanthine dehydrogenase family protein molybdopterin-binding subunit [Pseudodonghicola flavimaris]|uniref:Xanthine dehydrogenase family protein molybdopterin-binding subunit n=1 Tax=Pseudodonghicola flavimaris TaxID=3050036 RepID=A0ABT7F157_9RHOB|nr:xanthine dehydrogenase family protein molybdopterin-binding subunit [Pseudodonghicola flavimaris]MDK3018337.1 xanthine dehydrogenase family protein molybdopterin-binding subunit [Pseudodonghicola flavimaris]
MAETASGWIGAALRRREDLALTTGRGRFVDDIQPEGCLFLEVVRSPVAAGRITALDLEDARAAEGVVAVFSRVDLHICGEAAINMLIREAAVRLPLEVLADGKVSHVGQPVAAVVATSRALARDAADLVVLEVEEQQRVAPPIPVTRWHQGDAHAALAAAPVQVEARMDHARVAPMALEPRAALACGSGPRLEVFLSTQTPFRAREDICRILGMEPSQVHVTAPDVGGAFGGKASIYPEDLIVCFAARALQAPVKWVALRSEEFLAATHGRGGATGAALGLDRDGHMLALTADLAFQTGAWMPYSAYAPPRNAGRMLPGPYLLRDIDVHLTLQPGALAPVGIYRGAGRPEAVMLMERLVDKAARALGLDPLELRRRNLIPAAAMPYRTPTGETYDSGDLAGLLDRLEQVTGYGALRHRQAERRAAGEICGLGLALYVEPCGAGFETARLMLRPDGSFRADTGSSAQGQGRQTAVAQIVAEALFTRPDRVEVGSGDTDRLQTATGALASRSTAIGGSAMLTACTKLLERLRQAAATLWQQPFDQVRPAAGGLSVAGVRQDWAVLAPALEAAGLLPEPVEERYIAPGEAWASGAVLAEVGIDPETGVPEVERITWVDDAGRIVNPMLVEGQLLGGMAQGLGHALMERIVYDDDGQLLTGSLMDYAVPRAGDMPRAVRLEKRSIPSPANALGAKGVGEAGCIGVPPAVINAIQDAIAPYSARDLQPPLTGERIWRALNNLEDLT